MNGLWYVLLYVHVQTTLFARAQGPGDISAAIADAVTEVRGRRPVGLALASGTDPAGGAAGYGGTVGAPGSGYVADNPVSIHAFFSRRSEAPGVVAAFGTAGDISTTATANFATRTGGASPDAAEFSRQMAPYCPVRRPVCHPNDRYQTADGSCNNLNNPLWGASITNQARFLFPTYGDHGDQNIFCCNGNFPVVRSECFSFRTPPGDFQTTCMPFVRSDFGVAPGCPPESRNQINQRTSFLDLSVTYGNTLDGQNDLRELGTGKYDITSCLLIRLKVKNISYFKINDKDNEADT
ncbi:PXDN [Mytilus coruscus]|uniref:PXDN n=1 Tax=Mytilus coruscus TaxID=42192 RepID=A0A6J8C184_MYTCO|nr:PXDN [Mytilus coruscus]